MRLRSRTSPGARSVSVTASNTAAGANGLDTGSVANSTWYSVWVIYNPTTDTVAALLSTSATAPTMPSGYTFKARVGWNRTDGTADFLRVTQYGRRARYVTSDAVYPIIVPATTTGTASVGNYTAFSVANFVPSTADAIAWTMAASNGHQCLAPANTFGAANSLTAPPPAGGSVGSDAGTRIHSGEFMLEGSYPQSIYAVVGGNNMVVAIMGWNDNI